MASDDSEKAGDANDKEPDRPQTPPKQPDSPSQPAPATVKSKMTSARKLEDQTIFMSPQNIGRPPKRPNFGFAKPSGSTGSTPRKNPFTSPKGNENSRMDFDVDISGKIGTIQWDSDEDEK
ncbi:hypothetical protein ABW19_dt0206212 [Dactylella cylindrospora]|nr:hypothetical protein ABW19_dt0206212 [Dactylella cylindrospora]